MSLRLRCTSCRTAFLAAADQTGQSILCPKCGTRHRLPTTLAKEPEHGLTSAPANEPIRIDGTDPVTSVYVPSEDSLARASRSRWLWLAGSLAVLLLGGVIGIVYWPRVKPRPLDAVERVAEDYLKSLTKGDEEAQKRLSTLEEHPAIRSYQKVARDRSR